jgi:S1-C subfamily serine protease
MMHPAARRPFLAALALALCAGLAGPARAQHAVLKAEQERVAVVEKVKPTVVAIFARGGQGGGTGVLISDEGYALTNFHVVQPTGPTMQCGLPDGVLYDAVLVGLDKVGDVALIKLLPKQEGQKFPAAVLGDSDTVREGDWSIAMGNPFLLATDFNPTVTFGLVSGVHRYQYPAGVLLEYTDCIQIDTSINPGNSGGPLFNMKGELIGINGRGSFDKRARINSGVGYAISINQIKNFLGHLLAGMDTDHASLGALVQTQTEKGGLGRMTITSILEEADVARRGVEFEDELVTFAGRPITSVNHYRNILGVFPRGWRVPMEYRRENQKKEVLVRLMGVQRKGQPQPPDEGEQPPPGKPLPGKPGIPGRPGGKAGAPGPQGPGAKLYEARPGFANYYFNKHEKNRLLAAFRRHGDFSAVAGSWALEGDVRLLRARTESKFELALAEEKQGEGVRPVVNYKVGAFPYTLQPLQAAEGEVRMPKESGGLMPAMFLLQRMFTLGDKGFTECTHGGYEPLYPPPAEGKTPASLASLRVDAEVLNTRFGPFLTKFFFSRQDQKLIGLEMRLGENEDPCEVYLSDYRPVEGRLLPHRFVVQYGDTHYGTFTVDSYKLAAAK